MILNHFEIESSFQKKQLLELFFSGDFQNLKKMDFFFEKVKKFKTSFLSFSMSFGLMTLIFFPVKAETLYFSMVRILHSTDQHIAPFKASKCFRKVEKTFLSTGSKIVAFKDERCNYQSEVWNT